MPLQYWLAPHVHVCCTERQFILLDLKHDQYLSLDASLGEVLRDQISGWPSMARSSLGFENTADAEARTIPQASPLQDMVDAGVLVTDADHGKPATPVAIQRPTSALIDGYLDADTTTGISDVWYFALATLQASLRLRFQSLEAIAAHVRSRRERYLRRQRPGDCPQLDLQAARKSVAAYRRMRPLLFTSNSHCLFDTLVLCEFMAYRQLFPAWIFGINVDPFAAHCWLQASDVVIDDDPSRVRAYTPIMAL